MGRKLHDLYKVGKDLTLNDDSGEEPVTVYIKKLTPNEQDVALRRANGARAAVYAKLHDPESDEWKNKHLEVQAMSKDERIRTVTAQDLLRYRMTVESQLEHDEDKEWGKDGYLQGLRDAWDDIMQVRFAKDPSDEEAKRVHSELQRFTETVNAEVEAQQAAEFDRWNDASEEFLEKTTIEKLFEIEADTAWLKEFRKVELFYAVRDAEDHKKLYFEEVDDVGDLPIEVYKALLDEYQNLIVYPQVGKGLRAPAVSSETSVSTSKEETPQESGHLAAVP